MASKKSDGPDFKALTNTVGGITTGELQPDELVGIEEFLRGLYATAMRHAAKLPKGEIETAALAIASGQIADYGGDDEDTEGEESE